MWWKCEVQFCRNILRLKVWARNEFDARTKVERMYQLATIQNITLADGMGAGPGELLAAARELPEAAACEPLPNEGNGHAVR